MPNGIGQDQKDVATLYHDSLGTINWTESVQGLRKVKQVGVKFHFVRSKVEDCPVKTMYILSKDIKTDGLTKIFGLHTFQTHRDRMCEITKPPQSHWAKGHVKVSPISVTAQTSGSLVFCHYLSSWTEDLSVAKYRTTSPKFSSGILMTSIMIWVKSPSEDGAEMRVRHELAQRKVA